MQPACPRCRSERAYAETCVVRGIDHFLVAIHPLVHESNPPTSAMKDEDI